MSDWKDIQVDYPPTIIAFQDAMKLLKMASNAYEDRFNGRGACVHACSEIARAFERDGEQQ